jgi:hypothetical protein
MAAMRTSVPGDVDPGAVTGIREKEVSIRITVDMGACKILKIV